MQSVFEARLMTYPEERSENFESEVLSAFWSQDIRWKENSLLNAHEAKDTETVRSRLSDILNRLNDLS